MTYDIVVLGGGPAGLAAALAARGRGRSVLVVSNRWQDSPLAKAELVDNYLGLPGRTGIQMLQELDAHARGAGAELLQGRVVSMMAWEGYALTVGSDVVQCKALVLAPGVVRQAKFPGEDALLGRGVSYCATCDGMLFRGKPVTVVGRSPDAPHEAGYLKSIGCQVTYVAAVRPAELEEGIAFVKGTRLEIRGEGSVSALVADGAELPCAAVFVLRPAVAPSDLLPGLTVEEGRIVVDRQMRTNLPGVFAAGDCTGAPLQVAKAVGEGHIAGLTAAEYLLDLE